MNLFFAFLLIPMFEGYNNVVLFENSSLSYKGQIITTLYNGNSTSTYQALSSEVLRVGTVTNSIGNSNSVAIDYVPIVQIDVDGRWSGKYPENGTTLYPENFNPNIDNWSYPISSRYYFPEVYYFGVC